MKTRYSVRVRFARLQCQSAFRVNRHVTFANVAGVRTVRFGPDENRFSRIEPNVLQRFDLRNQNGREILAVDAGVGERLAVAHWLELFPSAIFGQSICSS